MIVLMVLPRYGPAQIAPSLFVAVSGVAGLIFALSAVAKIKSEGLSWDVKRLLVGVTVAVAVIVLQLLGGR